jgi:hypothetical protein
MKRCKELPRAIVTNGFASSLIAYPLKDIEKSVVPRYQLIHEKKEFHYIDVLSAFIRDVGWGPSTDD